MESDGRSDGRDGYLGWGWRPLLAWKSLCPWGYFTVSAQGHSTIRRKKFETKERKKILPLIYVSKCFQTLHPTAWLAMGT